MVIEDSDSFYENIAVEIRENLIRIRHHASLVVISGNNEIEEAVEYWWRDAGQNKRKREYIKIFENLSPY